MPEEKSGIHTIRCQDCDKVYMGQSKRNIRKKGQEHRRNAIKKEIDRSVVAKHFSEGHAINFKTELVKYVLLLNIYENIEM